MQWCVGAVASQVQNTVGLVTKAAALSVVGISTGAEIAVRFVFKFNKEFFPGGDVVSSGKSNKPPVCCIPEFHLLYRLG